MQKNPDDLDKYLGRFDREIDRLSELIEDLLRLSRLDQGRTELKIEPFDLAQVISEVVKDRVPLAHAHQLELNVDTSEGDVLVHADANLLGQVLSVLLSNAVHYTPPGGHILVRLIKEQQHGSEWAGFSVEDDGPGIEAEEIPRLFERFFRGKVGRESGTPGTGLGLAIAHEIVRRHHGRLEVESEGIPGGGTTFNVMIPTKGEIA